MNKIKLIFIILIIFKTNLIAEIMAGLIFSGVDTLHTKLYEGYHEGYFDFVLGRPCTSEVDYNSSEFNDHIVFTWDISPPVYVLAITPSYGLFKDFGKINLDSIKEAPPDSELVDRNGAGIYRVFNVTPDSLNSLIGTAYIIKTREDPRDDCPFYVKLKILNFNVIDSINHEVEMAFLWAYQATGGKDLETTGLDTFNIPTAIVSDIKKSALQSNKRRIKTVFKVYGNRINIPEHLVGKVRFAEVYDLRGRLLGIVSVANEKIFSIKNIVGVKEVCIIKLK